MPANAVWQYDYIDYYRLDEKIIDQYLREKWGLYKYHVKLVGDKYRFWVPQKLGKEEQDALLKRRKPKT
ncbi:MAG: hypothetical protein L6R36_004986 [Xanthoria steineri]|nr:MAG: hypothetical protein L6R36_004986 [Xanthoria steineri]